MVPNSGGFQIPAMPSSVSSSSSTTSSSSAAGGSGQGHAHSLSAGSSVSAGGGKYACPNCGKCFARDDLLRRHLAREARAMAQPQFDRQKSCFECARSKARCDLEVPSCGRCRSRGKQCVYGARSGNPNVRRQRDSTAPPNNLAAMNITHQHPHGSPYMGGWSNESYSDSGHSGASYRTSPGPRRHSGDDESGSESGTAWSDGPTHSSYGLSRSYSSGSSSSSSLNAPHLPPMQQPAPPNYPMPDNGNVVTPTTYLARHSMDGNYGPQHGLQQNHPQQHMQANRLVTDIDRSGMAFNSEEGEETPIGRYVNSFAAGPSSMDVKADPESTLRQRTSSLPQLSNAEGTQDPWPTGPPMGHGSLSGMPPQIHAANMSMGPPTQPSMHRPFVTGPVSTGQASQRPQPHRLLTGANMPQPSAASSMLGANPPSGKPLFSAMVDLSGWLEEPVAPSPLYPQGPSLASSLGLLIPKGPTDGGSMGAVSGDAEMTEQAQQQQQQQQQAPAQPQGGSDQIPASRYWWSNPPTQSDVSLMQSVAQATASHLSHYPHLMVLPDPSSPVPPTVHRPWMAHIRGCIPPSLAIARVILAGYAVRLPASEHIVWESVARETRSIVARHETTCARGSDLEVFGATEALFFYCILLMMCTDPGASAHVDMSLTNSAFYGLSELSKSLSMRLQAMQRASKMSSPGTDWMAWGFEETMRRTLWAAYAILVLQRFRDGAVLSEGHLAGVDLIMDVHLPAVAAEFEAGSEDEWRQALAASGAGTDAAVGADGAGAGAGAGSGAPEVPRYTFRDLLRWRPCNLREPQEQQATPQALLDYFDKHDAFVATVLSIAFCLDSSLSS